MRAPPITGFLARRLLLAAFDLVAVALLAFGTIRLLNPQAAGGGAFLPGLIGDIGNAFLHLDFGGAASVPGAPSIRGLWESGRAADISVVAGGFLIGVTAGVAGGVWCGSHPRSRSARLLEGVSILAFCAPVYAVALVALLVFNPTFGALPLPYFFDPHSYASLSSNPWDWFRSLLLPWIVVGAPLAAACLRLTRATVVEEAGQDYITVGHAKGLAQRDVRRHVARAAYPAIPPLVWGSVPIVVANVVLIEWIFSIPGFFSYVRSATAASDVRLLQALALWSAVLVITLSIVSDVVLATLDPRVRDSGLPG